MIRVIIERNINEASLTDYLTLIRKARKQAHASDGYIAGELLQSKDDPCHVVIISSWDNFESWDKWSESDVRLSALEEMRPLLNSEEKVTILENCQLLG
ncbi:MAG: antibiotic biosynthesis monooxygenase family protein [Kangiellaceae bacterium]